MSSLSRRSFLSIVVTFVLQLGMPGARAAASPSLKPTKVGQVIIWRGKKYTALKSGKKLVWDKGVVLPAPKSSPSSSASATPTPSASPSPSPTPSQTSAPAGSFEMDIAGSNEVPNGETRIFYPSDSRAKGKGFILTREKNALIVFDVNCTHETCPVEIEGPRLVCNCHNSNFNKLTGIPESGPASEPLKGYLVREVAGRILVTDSV
ncbi:MAG: Rieske (2Fe-2S) protein [Actinobacteria bacterium]|nr:Rieske (2Fe-2S) protein [Actinomycetota bacterium]